MRKIQPPFVLAPLAVCLLPGSPALAIGEAGHSDHVGAVTPFVTLEAEAGELAGGASVRHFELGSPVPEVATLELEASGGALVHLGAAGASVAWRNPLADANSIVVRASLPDSPSGGGQTATLNLYVDGKFRQAIQLSSKQSWVYRGSKGWVNDPAEGMAFKFYNEDRAIIAGPPIALGSVLMLRKDEANRATEYNLDCLDLEKVGPPLTQPPGSLSILQYGADPTGGTDSQAAIEKCVDDARLRSLVVWVPPGRYLVGSVLSRGLDFTGLTVQGAGMWHSLFYRRVPDLASEPGAKWRSYIKVGSGTHLSDVSIDSNASRRLLAQPGGSDYGVQASGENWLVQRVWVQHCDANWMSGSNGIIRDCRVADSWGDGINLNNGNKPNPAALGINLSAENNFVRGTGDDGLATFSDRGAGGNNGQMVGTKIMNNTAVAPYWANCLRVAGGKDVVVRNNLLLDSASNSGMTVGVFGETGQALESAVIEGNVILRGGGWNTKNRHGLAVDSRRDEYSTVLFRDNVIRDSRRAGVFIGGKLQMLSFENNRIIHPATNGIVIGSGVSGTGNFEGNMISELNAGQLPLENGSEKTFATTIK